MSVADRPGLMPAATAGSRWLTALVCAAVLAGAVGCSSSRSAGSGTQGIETSAPPQATTTGGGTTAPSPAATPATSTALAPAAFGSAVTDPAGGDTAYTGAFPAGPDDRSTILTQVAAGDSPGVVWQLVDAAGHANPPGDGTQVKLGGDQSAGRAACGVVATRLHGVASVSSLYFVETAAQGVTPAQYDAYLYTWDGTLGHDPIVKTLIADGVQGVPTCNAGADGAVRSRSYSDTAENQWTIQGTTDSGKDVGISYLPAQTGTDPSVKHVFVSIDTGKVTPISMQGQQHLDFVVGNGVKGVCGPASWSEKPCSLSVDGKIAAPSASCDGSANCTYSNLPGSDGLAVEADRPEGVSSQDSIGRVLDPLTGAVRFTTGDVPFPDAAVYDAASGTIIVFGDRTSLGGNANEVVGFDAKAGAKLWTVPADKLCGSNAGGVLVAANGQLALLSPRDGKQIASTAALSTCTPGPGAGIGIGDGGRLVSLLAG